MRRVLAMQIQVVRRPMGAYEDGQILLIEMRIDLMARMEGEQKRIVGVVGVENEHGAQVESVISGDSRQIGVEQVVPLVVKLRVLNAEGLVKVRAGAFDLREVF